MTGFFATIGEAVQIGTLVEYYDYIKAVEYLICIGFLVAFPIFYENVIMHDNDAGKRDR